MEFLQDDFQLCVCDTETLDRWDDAIVLSASFVYGDLREPLTFEDLVTNAFFMKFKAGEQLRMGRKTSPSTLDWWKSDKVSEEARIKSLYPNELEDKTVGEFISKFTIWAHQNAFEPKKCTMMDRNLFDFKKLQHIIEVSMGLDGHEPWHYHHILDVTSVLKAWGAGRYGGIDIRKLDGVCYHNPIHDAAVDWLRVRQSAINAGLIENVIRGE